MISSKRSAIDASSPAGTFQGEAGLPVAEAHDGGTDFAAGGAAGFADVEAQSGSGAADLAHDGGKEVAGGGCASADSDAATFEASELSNGFDAGVDRVERLFAILTEDETGLRGLKAATGAVDEGGSDFSFELLEHRGERGLGEAKFVGGPREVPFLEDDSEVADRGEFQRCSLCGPGHDLGGVEMVILGEVVGR